MRRRLRKFFYIFIAANVPSQNSHIKVLFKYDRILVLPKLFHLRIYEMNSILIIVYWLARKYDSYLC